MYRLCCDDMPFLFFVKTGDAFDGHIVCFSGSRREDDIFWLSANKVRDMLIDCGEIRNN